MRKNRQYQPAKIMVTVKNPFFTRASVTGRLLGANIDIIATKFFGRVGYKVQISSDYTGKTKGVLYIGETIKHLPFSTAGQMPQSFAYIAAIVNNYLSTLRMTRAVNASEVASDRKNLQISFAVNLKEIGQYMGDKTAVISVKDVRSLNREENVLDYLL